MNELELIFILDGFTCINVEDVKNQYDLISILLIISNVKNAASRFSTKSGQM
jgi:hypothetical protein